MEKEIKLQEFVIASVGNLNIQSRSRREAIQ
jgi:hypothetical protein